MHVTGGKVALALALILGGLRGPTVAQTPPGPPAPAPAKPTPEQNLPWHELPDSLRPYFERRVAEISGVDWQAGVTKESWPATQAEMRVKLRGMLGLDPWPERTPLNAVVTGTHDGDGYVVENLHFQSLPGVYVGANFYRPTGVTSPVPTILYACGHADKTEGGVRYGNKTGYQHHGVWFARHGYACLIIDTIQLGEIPGEHHGTYKHDQWWWAARGYTPAGVEAWNGIRALDYLESRPEVDKTKIGMTGRSGGGAYTWWVSALDDRVKVAVPVAGIATLKNHVLDGCVEGHCDCMFMVNTERWDYDRVAALVAPRPLLICNTDKDTIFPLDGVVKIYNKTRRLYKTLGHEDLIGLHIAEGPHKDVQPLNIAAFAWMDRHLKGKAPTDLIDEAARPAHELKDLKVFAAIPADERVTTVQEFFVPAAKAPPIPTPETWPALRDQWKAALLKDSFRAWPPLETKPKVTVLETATNDKGVEMNVLTIETEPGMTIPAWSFRDTSRAYKTSNHNVFFLDEADGSYGRFLRNAAAMFPATSAFGDLPASEEQGLYLIKGFTDFGLPSIYVAPRGVGPTGWADLPESKGRQIQRRFLLLGESVEGGQVWDIRQAVAVARLRSERPEDYVAVHASPEMALNAVYAMIFSERPSVIFGVGDRTAQREGPIYLNVLRHLDIPQAVLLSTENGSKPFPHPTTARRWRFTADAAEVLGRTDLLQGVVQGL